MGNSSSVNPSCRPVRYWRWRTPILAVGGRPRTGHLRRRATNSATKVTNKVTNTATRAPIGIGSPSFLCRAAFATTRGSLVLWLPLVNALRLTAEGPRR